MNKIISFRGRSLKAFPRLVSVKFRGVPRRAFHWLTATRRRKALAFLLSLLLLLTSIRFAFFRGEAQAAWWPGDGTNVWGKRQMLTVTNNSGDSLASGTTIAITLDSKSLVSQGKLQADCDDVRIVYDNGSTQTLLDRYLSYPGGGTCGTSEATKVYFKLQSTLSDGSSSSYYYLYYNSPHASAPSDTVDTFDVGTTANALLVCPFDGTTECINGDGAESPTTETGPIRYSGSKSALSFDPFNSSDYVTVTDSLSLDITDQLTIEAWIKPFNNPESNPEDGSGWGSSYIFGRSDNDENCNNWARTHGLYQYYQGFRFGLNINGCHYATTATIAPYNLNQWYHVAGTYDGSNLRIFVDGVLKETIAASGSIDTNNLSWYVRRSLEGDAIAQEAYIDELRVSDVTRYTSNFTPQTSPFIRDEHTKLLMHFDENGDLPTNASECTTGEACDDSGNGNHGTITGAKYVSGLVGVNNGTTDTGYPSNSSYASNEGIFIEEATTNKITNPSFEHATYDTNWDAQQNLNPSNNIDTSTAYTATAENYQRKTWFDGTRYWISFYSGSNTEFWYSTDGSNWTQNTNATNTFGNAYSVIADSSHAYLVYKLGADDIAVISATSYPGTNFGWSSATTVFNGSGSSDRYYYPVITQDTDGQLWIGTSYYNGSSMTLYAVESTNPNDITAWNSSTQLGSVASINAAIVIVPLNSGDMYAVIKKSTSVVGCFYDEQTDNRWEDSSGNDCTNGANQDSIGTIVDWGEFSATADTTNYDVHLVFPSDIVYYRWDNGTGTNGAWQSAATIKTAGIDTAPSITIETNTRDLYIIWREDTNDDLYYSFCDLSAASAECSANGDWSDETDWGDTAALDGERVYTTSNYSGAGRVFVIWTDGTASPYSINFASILGPEITATEETSAPYYKFGSKSAKLVASGNAYFDIPIDPNAATSHTLSAYVYDGTTGNVGGTVSNTVAQLVWEGAAQSGTTYTDMGGGWWRLSYSTTTTDSSNAYGVYVLDGKTVYVDGVQLEAKAYATTYADGSLTSDAGGANTYFWDDDCDGTLDAGEDETADQNSQCSSRLRTRTKYATSSNLNNDNGSVSLWYKPSFNSTVMPSEWSGYHFQYNIDSSNEIRIEWYATNDSFILFKNTTAGGGDYATNNTTFSANQWIHLVGTWSSTSGIAMYVNNDTPATNADATTMTGSNTNFSIGDNGAVANLNSVNGNISDFRIFDTALTAAEVADLYYSGLVSHQTQYEVDAFNADKGQNPVAIYHFDPSTGSGQVAYDSSQYGNHLTVTGATFDTQSENARSQLMHTLKFDGTDDIASRSGELKKFNFGTGGFSLSGWFRHPSSVSGTQTLVSRYNSTTSTGYQVYMNSSGYLCFDIGDGTNTDSICTTTSYADSRWYHFEAVKDATSSIKLYVNANEIASDQSLLTNGSLNNSSNFSVGVSSNKSNYYSGFLDEIVVYPYARSADQVKADVLGSQTSAEFGLDPSDPLSHGLVGYWKMDESSLNSCSGGEDSCDSSGNGNHGTYEVSMDANDQVGAKFGNGVDFDGTDDYVSFTSLDMEVVTFAAWVYSDTKGDSDYPIIINTPAYNLQFTRPNPSYDNVGFNAGWDSGIGHWHSPTSSISDGTWYHIVVTHDNSSKFNDPAIYINGVSQTVTEDNRPYGNVRTSNAGTGYIANRSALDRSWDGKIDDVRIYNRALSPSEVADLYHWAPGPVAYYKFDEGTGTSSVYDSSGNGFTGTMNGSMTESDWVNGKYGKALDFDGNNDRVDYDGDLQISSYPFTLSTWAKATGDSAGTNRILGIGDKDVSNVHYSIAARDTDNVVGVFAYDGTNQQGSYGTTDLDDREFHHIAVVFNSNTERLIYVDGILEGTGTTSVTFNTNVDGLRIGDTRRNFPPDTPFQGIVDDAKIYNYARTQAQIVEDMNAGHPAPGSPIGSAAAEWKFDEGYGTTIQDFSINNKDLTSSGATWIEQGKNGKAMNFDGTDDYASSTAGTSINLYNKSEYSVCGWIRPESAGEDSAGEWFSKGSSYVRVDTESSGTVEVTALFDLATDASLNTTKTISTETWHHICVAWQDDSDDELTVYIDGISAGSSVNGSGAPVDDSAATLYIGGDSSNNFNGFIDEVQIYNSYLTSDQVKIVYNQGSSQVMGKTTEYKSSSFWDGLVGYWKMDESSWTTDCATDSAMDSSGNGNHGDSCPNGSGPTTASGKFGNAGSFDGGSTADDYVLAGSDSSIDDVFDGGGTVTAWINLAGAGELGGRILAKETGPTGWSIFPSESGTTEAINLRVYFDGSSGRWYTGLNVNENSWVHMAVVYNDDSDTNDPQIYLNGVSQSLTENNTPSGTYVSDASQNLAIGAYPSGSQTMDGKIDEVRVYNRALSPSEVSDLYHWAPGPVGYWPLDEGTGTSSVYDHSGNNQTGTMYYLTESDWVPGKFGSALNFDVTDINERIQIAHNDIQNPPNDMTAEAWFRTPLTNNSKCIVQKNQSGEPWKSWAIAISYARVVYFHWYNSSAVGYIASSDSYAYNANQWHHLAGVKNGTSLKVYLDGVDVTSTPVTTSGTIYPASSVLSISNTDATWQGQIDDIRLYNYARTPEQIMEDFAGGSPDGAPIGHWKFDECSGTTAYDWAPSGQGFRGNNGTINAGSSGNLTAGTCNSGVSTEMWNDGTNGKRNASLGFDNNDDIVDLGDKDIFSFGDGTNDKPFTFSTWVYNQENTTGDILSKSDVSGGNEYRFYISGTGFILFINGSGGNYTITTASGVIPLNTWSYITATYDGSKSINGMNLYVNGKLLDVTRETGGSYTAMSNTSTKLSIGARWNGSTVVNPFYGQIDDVRVYNFALNEDQIRNLYNEGAVRFGGN